MNRTDREYSRREFFRAAARGAAMTAMAAVAAALTVRAVRLGENKCTGRGLCRRCGSLGGCELPQALVTRSGGMEK